MIVCCFGELLLRFSPVLGGGWIEQAAMPVFVGGAELNVATALAGWAVPTRYATVLPDHALTHDVVDYLIDMGIDPSGVIRAGRRIGSYYLPQGADLKNAGVIYDRANSGFSELKPGQTDWKPLLAGVRWLHISAISPALNADVAAVCLELLTVASARNITISIDLNYRAKLWQYGALPTEVMPDLVRHCDVVMGNIWAAQSLLGIPVDETRLTTGHRADYVAHAEATARELQRRFPRCRTVANTFRFEVPTTGGLRYFATLHTDGQVYTSPEFSVSRLVDRVGSGDCFMAGLIYGLYHHHAPADVLAFAASAAVGKFGELGDATRQTVTAVNQRLTDLNL
jgi:2-dehydro-3-deoxygluconokinase